MMSDVCEADTELASLKAVKWQNHETTENPQTSNYELTRLCGTASARPTSRGRRYRHLDRSTPSRGWSTEIFAANLIFRDTLSFGTKGKIQEPHSQLATGLGLWRDEASRPVAVPRVRNEASWFALYENYGIFGIRLSLEPHPSVRPVNSMSAFRNSSASLTHSLASTRYGADVAKLRGTGCQMSDDKVQRRYGAGKLRGGRDSQTNWRSHRTKTSGPSPTVSSYERPVSM